MDILSFVYSAQDDQISKYAHTHNCHDIFVCFLLKISENSLWYFILTLSRILTIEYSLLLKKYLIKVQFSVTILK